MSEEDRRKELADDIFSQCKDLQIRYCDCAEIAGKLIELNYDNVWRAIEEFVDEVKRELNDLLSVEFTGKTKKQYYQRRGMETGLEMALRIIEKHIDKRFGDKK